MKKTYQISETVWLYPGKAGWYFVTIPQDVATNIDFYFTQNKRGWGSLPVQVTLGNSTWKTSIFPDKESGSYLLPLKAEIRKKESIENHQQISFQLEIH